MENLSSLGVFLLAVGVFLLMAAWRLGPSGSFALFLAGLLSTAMGATLVRRSLLPRPPDSTFSRGRPAHPGFGAPCSVVRCEWRDCARLR